MTNSFNDRELVHDAYLEVMSDPESYSQWQYDFITSLEDQFKDRECLLTPKQITKLQEILEED